MIDPDWPAPSRVFALQTTRRGGVSVGAFASLNLGDHVGDDPGAVSANRARLAERLPGEPLWLRQVHGVGIAETGRYPVGCEADAAIARRPGQLCVVMTADCLPVLLCDRAGTVVAAVHGGWRSLAAGLVEKTVTAMGVAGGGLLAWLGPAIGPEVFEVGGEVRNLFVQHDPPAETAFRPRGNGKYLADIYDLARLRLASVGVDSVYGGNLCTVGDSDRFFSFRRDGATGRMATIIGLV